MLKSLREDFSLVESLTRSLNLVKKKKGEDGTS